MIEIVLLVALGAVVLAAVLISALGGRPRGYESTRVLDQQNAPHVYGRGQKLNPAGVAAIPVATSNVIPDPPPPPGGRPRREVFVCTCTYRGRNDGLPRV